MEFLGRTRIHDGIILNLEGTYDVFVSIQDGIEYIGNFTTKELAVKEYKEACYVYNHWNPTKKDIKMFKEHKRIVESFGCTEVK